MNKFTNLVIRACSGALFISVVTASVLLGAYACAVMLIVVVVWSMLEFYAIVIKDRVRVHKLFGVLSGVFLFTAGFFYVQDIVSGRVFLLLIPLAIVLFISQLYSKDFYSFRAIAYTIVGIVYIALPVTLFVGLMFPHSDGKYTHELLLGFFILLWANDTFAYLTGISFGRHRLFERISPKKSWEGFFGGLICTVLLSLLIAKLLPILPFYHWMAVAVLIVIFGVYGDLIESLLKRNLKVKDSGRFLPGHGGILDRFDSVLPAAPMVFFYLKMFVFQQ